MVLSLKTWKSRSLPGLPRTETSHDQEISDAKASRLTQKPPWHCRGGFLHWRCAARMFTLPVCVVAARPCAEAHLARRCRWRGKCIAVVGRRLPPAPSARNRKGTTREPYLPSPAHQIG